MYKTTNNNLRGLASASQDLDSIWDKMVSAYASKGTTDLKNLKNQRLTAEQLDPYFFRAVDSYRYGNSPDELFKFMDYIWAWSSGYEFSNNDSNKIRNFMKPELLNFTFTNPNKLNSPSYLVTITFTLNNNASIDKMTNWQNFVGAFSDLYTLQRTPVMATMSVIRLSDATPFVIYGNKLIDSEVNKAVGHTNQLGDRVTWQSNWDVFTKNKTNAFSIKNVQELGYAGLISKELYTAFAGFDWESNSIHKFAYEKINKYGLYVWHDYIPMGKDPQFLQYSNNIHLGLTVIDNPERIPMYAFGSENVPAGLASLVYDCYSYEYLYFKYGKMPLKLREQGNPGTLHNIHYDTLNYLVKPDKSVDKYRLQREKKLAPQQIGIYQMPNGDYYWSADGIFFCNWTEPTPNDKKDLEIIKEGDKMPDVKCPTVKCYTETTDKKLYLNRVKVSSDDIPFTVRQKITKCKPKDTQPKQKYYCEDNEIDEKIYRLLENMGGSANGGATTGGANGGKAGGVQQGSIGR